MLETVSSLVGCPRCLRCRKPGSVLCERCGGRLPAARASRVAGARWVHAAWEHEAEARSLVLALKAGGMRPAADVLAARMCTVARSAGIAAEVVAWVPARRADIRRRGFDHAEVLARGIACRIGLPARRLLHRRADRPDQVGLTAAERRINLLGAFESETLAVPVLLVDDVLTTGATAAACVGALKRAGACTVEVLTACRA